MRKGIKFLSVAVLGFAAACSSPEKMAEMEVILSIKSGKDGRTFGSVSTKEIAVALKEQHGLAIDKKKLVLDEPIRTVGTTIVGVKLHREVTAKINVRVREA